MVPIIYNEDIIVSHLIAKHCLCLLDEVSQRDYNKVGIFSSKIKCLALDDYETKFCGGSKDNTMDAAVGISDYQNNRKVNHRLLLVELRLDYQSSRNLDKSSLVRKIKHSKDLLSESRIAPNSCFIFSEEVAPKAQSWVRRFAREFSANWEVMNPIQFNAFIKFESDMPYQPENDLDRIKEVLYECLKKLLEFEAITDTLWDIWKSFDIAAYSSDEMDILESEIEKEDLQILIGRYA